jgi:hypothetical protein
MANLLCYQEMDAVKSYRAENLWIGNAVDGSGGGGHNSFEKQSTFVRNNLVDKASTIYVTHKS